MARAAIADELPVVIKVGGSLHGSDRLAEVLAVIATARRPVVVVPGGGIFADKVRDLQPAAGFDDATAHRLAMLGMHQMAAEFVKLEPQLALADSLDAIASLIEEGSVPVWLPLPMMETDRSVPWTWSTTSDSLAARLAELLGGATVVLLKSVDVALDTPVDVLDRDGVVDEVFPVIVSRARLAWRIFGPSDGDAFKAFLGDEMRRADTVPAGLHAG